MNRDSAIIIPVHNRRAITLACLRRLTKDDVYSWARVIVVDDGSTDGTADAVRVDFPKVDVLHGTGSLWWTGAITVGMMAAFPEANYILWLNDDSKPMPGALRRLRDLAEAHHAMVGGTCIIPGSEVVVYGGLRRRGFAFDLLPRRPGMVEPCDAVSGNLVCFPSKWVDLIGWPDAHRLPHAIGDLDYGLRARAAGLPVLVAHDAVGEAVPNRWENHASWLLSDIPVADIWRSAWRRNSYGYFPTQWHFFTRHWGLRGSIHAIALLLKRVPIMGVRLLVPQLLLRRLLGSHSQAWREEQRLRRAMDSGLNSEKPDPSGRVS